MNGEQRIGEERRSDSLFEVVQPRAGRRSTFAQPSDGIKLPIAHPLRAAVSLEDDELDAVYFVEAIRLWMRLSEVVQ